MKKTKTLLTAAAVGAVAGGAFAEEMTIVSWGGAYSKSQLKAYHEPYSEKTGVTILNDDSSAEAVAKLRAMNEAGNITWDVVDVVAADAIRLCDEGLALEIDFDTQLAPAPDGTPASEDFGDLLVSDCFIPQIVYSTTFGYRTDLVGDTPPNRYLRCVRSGSLPRQALAWKNARSTIWNGPFCAMASRRKMSMTFWPLRKVRIRRWPSWTPSKTALSGGLRVPTRRSCWPMERLSWVLPITAVCSA